MKPMFLQCSKLVQDDLGVENGGQNEVNIVLKSCLGAFQDGFGAGLPLGIVLGSILGPPRTSKIMLSLKRGAIFF